MASFQSSSADLEAKAMADIKAGGILHFDDLAASSPPNLSQLLPATERGHSRDGDALVPSFSPTSATATTSTTSPLTPTVPTTTKPTNQDPPKSNWDDAFYNSTPTPKPPPRLAPMPRSPPPPPLAIRTHRQQQQDQLQLQQPTVTAGGATPVSDQLEMLAPKSKSRYASAYHAHNRSLSHNQAHSHHGNNVFSSPNSVPNNGNGNSSEGGSPILNSFSTLASTHQPVTSGGGFNPDHQPVDGTPKGFSASTLSHASPAAARSAFRLDSPHLRHPQGHASSHHLPSSVQSNPLLTPSSSQSNLFSNLPSPLTKTCLSSTANIFKDPPASSGSYQPLSFSSLPSSWVSTQTAHASIGDDISEMSVLLSQDHPQHQQRQEMVDTNAAASPISNTNTNSSMTGVSTNDNGQQQQRKIYPGLKNTVGPYRLLHNIGQGSFSEVKLAVDTRTGDHVAIKVMSRAMVQSSDRLGISVRRESDLLKSIQHPNIVNFREVVETSLQLCIVLDYASGGELFEYVADKRALASEQDIQCIFAQLVDAVDYLHQLNIVHRDLKLENVLLEPQPGAPLRPKDYAAPEIILGQPYDGREADIWSLGVVLYALLVGFLPFNMRPGSSRKSFLSTIAHAEFGFPGEKVLMTKASLMNMHQRSSSTASNASSSSAVHTHQHQQSTSTGAGTRAGAGSTGGAMTTLLPAATPDTTSTLDSTLAATASATTTSMIVPKMRGVSAVSEESKDLVRWLLKAQGSDRPTARQLRDHPWVAAGRATLTGSGAPAISTADGGSGGAGGDAR
ncbi:CBL-interacting serine/threonine-protein kinase 24 [Linnemannia exigua]|uniref:CBL-interacting serine/threonine-protein kinase 24 n=1 Tax=Linnemannia exigua TaxID=604196 RepID=A0AAD4DGQ4_9FUNG|nr:CBL-interacting serine/threonine-protein kinase 24 [Linnemannia exigua]